MANDITGMALGEAYVDIMGNTNKLAADLASAQGMVTGFIKKVATGAIIASPFLLAGGVIMKSFKSWMEEETGIARMGNMFDAVGIKASELAPKIEALASEMMRTTTLTDDQIRSMATQAAQMGVAGSAIEGYVKAAIGLGARLGRDPESAMRLIIRASQGHMQMLSRLGVQIDTTKSKQYQFNQLMEFAAKGMKVAEKETNTLAGAFKQMRNSFGEVFDALGKGLFEKSGLNAEIKKITATFFGVVKSLEKGFEVGAFKGFNFKGLGDFISSLIMKFTAMVMTLPTVFQALYAIFSKPDRIIYLLGEGMISIAKLFMITLAESLGTLKGVFIGLGKILVSVFAEGIANLPIPGMKSMVSSYYGKQYLKGMSFEEQAKAIGYKGSYTPGAVNTPESYAAYKEALSNFLDSFGDIMPEKMSELRERMMRSGFNEAMNAIPTAVQNTKVALKEEIKRLNGLIKAETGVDILSVYKGNLEALLRYKVEAEQGIGQWGPRISNLPPKMGVITEKASTSITSFSEFWKKAQESANKTEDPNLKYNSETAENTKNTLELLKERLPMGRIGLVSNLLYGTP